MKELLLNNQKIANGISIFLKREFKKRKKRRAILAISGGVDSTTCAFLCKKAGLDLYAVILPYKNRGREGKKLAKILNLPKDRIITVDIGSMDYRKKTHCWFLARPN